METVSGTTIYQRIGGEAAISAAVATGRSLATFYGADYRYLRGRGHNVLLEPNWRETASMVAAWLGRETRIGAA
jgi:hypothetical protein